MTFASFTKPFCVLAAAFALTGCHTIYYNAKYLDEATAQARFEQDQLACRAYANGTIPMPPAYQVQNYDYRVQGNARTRPTFMGYETTYDAQVTATPSTTDAMLSTANSIGQLAATISRENRFKNCLRSLGWTTNRTEAFPNAGRVFKAQTTSFGAVTADAYEPEHPVNKLPFVVSMATVQANDLVFRNGKETYQVSLAGVNDVVRKELQAHFKEVVLNQDTDVRAALSFWLSVDPASNRYQAKIGIQFVDKANRQIYNVFYQNDRVVPTEENQFDTLALQLTQEAINDIVSHAGWVMTQRDFEESFSRLTPTR